MNTITSFINKIKESFTWRMFPTREELKLKSIVEFVFFLVILFAFFFAYYAGNRVPVREVYLRVEQLAQNDTVKGVQKFVPRILLQFPMTSTKLDTVGGLTLLHRFDEYIVDSIQDAANKSRIDSILTAENIKDKIAKNRALPLIDGNVPISIDSLRSIFYNHYKNYKKAIIGASFAFNKGPNSISVSKPKGFFDETIKGNDTTYCNYRYVDNPSKYVLETYMTGGNIKKLKSEYVGKGDVLGKPEWYRFEDISQSYFIFRLNTETIDSMYLKIDFTGVTEFSKMDPEPDEINMSSIVFKDQSKIRKIQANGLQFHTIFTEVQNLQAVRMFFVSAGFGSILLTFIGFIFVSLCNWIRFLNKRAFGLFLFYLIVFLIVLQLLYELFQLLVYLFLT